MLGGGRMIIKNVTLIILGIIIAVLISLVIAQNYVVRTSLDLLH